MKLVTGNLTADELILIDKLIAKASEWDLELIQATLNWYKDGIHESSAIR